MESRPLEINMVITRVHISNIRNFGTKDATANLKLQPCYKSDFKIYLEGNIHMLLLI